MAISVNKTNDGTVRRMALTGAATGTFVALCKTGKINTQAADAFVKKIGGAVKAGDTATIKEGGKTLFNGVKNIGLKIADAAKEFWAKDGGAKAEMIKGKANSLLEGAKGIGKKVINAGKDFWAKDSGAKAEMVKGKANSLWEGAKGIGKKVVKAGKDFWAKDSGAKAEMIKGKANSLLEGAKGIGKKGLNAAKDFWAKNAPGAKEAAKNILKNPSTKYIAGITAAFVALGLIIKGIKNHRAKA